MKDKLEKALSNLKKWEKGTVGYRQAVQEVKRCLQAEQLEHVAAGTLKAHKCSAEVWHG